MTGKDMSRYKQLLAQRAKLDEEIEAARKIATQHAIEHARRVAPAAALADTPFPGARRQATVIP